MTSVAKSNSTPWKRPVVSGIAHWAFHAQPRRPDVKYGKPAMYMIEVELTDKSEVYLEGAKVAEGIEDSRKALKALRITPKEAEGRYTVKFQSKVVEPEDAVKNKPQTIDSKGDDLPSEILVGNGSFVRVKGSLPDYAKNPPEAGRRPMVPRFETLQVIDLVQYVGGDTSSRGMPAVEGSGYTVEGGPSKVVHKQAAANDTAEADDDGDPFAGLENTSDLDPVPSEKPKPKRVSK